MNDHNMPSRLGRDGPPGPPSGLAAAARLSSGGVHMSCSCPTANSRLPILLHRHPATETGLVPTPDQMHAERLAIVRRRLQTEYHLSKHVLHLQRLHLYQKLLKPFYVIGKDQWRYKSLCRGPAKKATHLSLATLMPAIKCSADARISFLS